MEIVVVNYVSKVKLRNVGRQEQRITKVLNHKLRKQQYNSISMDVPRIP